MPSPDETPPPTVRAGRVTALRPTKRDPDRIAVDLDGSFAFALPATLVGDERIEVGDLLDVDRVTALLAADQASRATETALVFLSYRPRSEKEVRDRLRRGGYEPDVEPLSQNISNVRIIGNHVARFGGSSGDISDVGPADQGNECHSNVWADTGLPTDNSC